MRKGLSSHFKEPSKRQIRKLKCVKMLRSMSRRAGVNTLIKCLFLLSVGPFVPLAKGMYLGGTRNIWKLEQWCVGSDFNLCNPILIRVNIYKRTLPTHSIYKYQWYGDIFKFRAGLLIRRLQSDVSDFRFDSLSAMSEENDHVIQHHTDKS